jgi:hypothetical protein
MHSLHTLHGEEPRRRHFNSPKWLFKVAAGVKVGRNGAGARNRFVRSRFKIKTFHSQACLGVLFFFKSAEKESFDVE